VVVPAGIPRRIVWALLSCTMKIDMLRPLEREERGVGLGKTLHGLGFGHLTDHGVNIEGIKHTSYRSETYHSRWLDCGESVATAFPANHQTERGATCRWQSNKGADTILFRSSIARPRLWP